jgi:hypothetical protein
MTIVLRLIPVFLSSLLLAAHFSRANQPVLLLAALALPFLLLIRQPWSARTVQLALILGGLEWLRAAWGYVRQRMETGEPWGRLVAILGAVTLFTWASALVFRSPRLRSVWFGSGAEAPLPPGD